MTRRKRTPSPDRSRKRVAFDIPASLQQFSALSRSLAAQNENAVQDERESEQEENEQDKASQRGNSTIVARAHVLGQSPTNGPTSTVAGASSSFSPLPSFPSSSASSSKGIRFKYDPRQFPDQQKWPQPSLNPGAVGHARFLERQWQSAQAAQVAENMRQAQHVRHQMEQAQAQEQEQEHSTTSTTYQPARSDNSLPHADVPLTPASGNMADPTTAGASSDDGQSQPESTPRRGSRRQRFEVDIEQRRQAIIARLMETNPASIATPSSNIQIPASSTQVQAGSPSSSSSIAGDKESQAPSGSQSELIAALIAKKRAENAANGSLNRWLSARQKHKQAQEAARSTPESQSASLSQRESSQSPASPFIFNPHSAGHSINLSGQTRLVSGPGLQDVDLGPLFSSPALAQTNTHPTAPSQTDEHGHAGDRVNATHLPSPSVSSSSPSEVRWLPSPSAQLLVSLAQAAPAPPLPSQAQHTFRPPSLIVDSKGLASTSSLPQRRPSSSHSSLSIETSAAAQQHAGLNMMLQQQQQQQQQQNEQQERGLQRLQQIAQAGHAHYVQQQPLTQHPTQQQPQQQQQQQQQPHLPPSPSPSVRPNDSGYYQNKPPSLWAPFSSASSAAAVAAANNALGLRSDYGISAAAIDPALATATATATSSAIHHPASRSAVYAAFGGGGGGGGGNSSGSGSVNHGGGTTTTAHFATNTNGGRQHQHQ